MTKEDFKIFVENIEKKDNYKKPIAYGIARIDYGQSTNKPIQATFLHINFKENYGSSAVMLEAFIQRGVNIDFDDSEFINTIELADINFMLDAFKPFLNEDSHKNIEVIKAIKENYEKNRFAFVAMFEDTKPKSLEMVYLKLYLLSLKKVAIRSINLDGAFGILPNLAWSDGVPYELEYLKNNEILFKASNKTINIDFVDKFPRFLAHIIPEDNIRILESSKVRMGASLAPGTTIMPGAAYVNFNSGTTGACMVEGRISSSVIVGEGTDIGGGASILGVLSGTSGNAISIGKRCLLGANSVTGIPLGDNCIVDAGIAVLEGTKFAIKDKDGLKKLNPNFNFDKELFKGIELAYLNGLHFRQNSQTGQMLVSPNKKAIKLNSALH